MELTFRAMFHLKLFETDSVVYGSVILPSLVDFDLMFTYTGLFS
jgi:hypothetical protein